MSNVCQIQNALWIFDFSINLFRLNVDIFYNANQRYNVCLRVNDCISWNNTHICQLQSAIWINGHTFQTNIVLNKTRFRTIEYRLPHP